MGYIVTVCDHFVVEVCW